MTHSPEPWVIDVDEFGRCWIRIPGGHDLYFGDMETTDKCCFDNARLITAAPKMLAACRALLNAQAGIEWVYEDAGGVLPELDDAIELARIAVSDLEICDER